MLQGNGIGGAGGADWHRQFKLLYKAFTPKTTQLFLPLVASRMDEWLNKNINAGSDLATGKAQFMSNPNPNPNPSPDPNPNPRPRPNPDPRPNPK